MVNDPIGDMIIQLKNAGLAGLTVVEIPYSKIKHTIADILVRERYIKSAEKIGEDPKAKLRIILRYVGKLSAISGVKRVSKPGARWYVNCMAIQNIIKGSGISVVSTSKGIMTSKEAATKGIGGEVLCNIW